MEARRFSSKHYARPGLQDYQSAIDSILAGQTTNTEQNIGNLELKRNVHQGIFRRNMD
jgi:hypothetical protein